MHHKKIVLLSIFLVALGLRFVLCIYNREANDNHMEVINWILHNHSLPAKEDCWECSQPKAWYLLNVGILNAFHIRKVEDKIIAVQMVNFVFSFFILLFLWMFINRQRYSDRLKLFSFALVALNPCLIGINVQATNDTLAILAGVATVYYASLFFERLSAGTFAGMCLSVIVASIVKGSGLILMVALVLVFAAM